VSNGGWYTIAKKIEGYRVKKLKGPGSKENANRGVSEIDFTKSDAGSIEKREARRREQASRAESQRIEAMRQEQERREEQQRQQERLEAQRRALEVSEAQRIERERVAQERLEEQRLRQQEAEQRRFDQQRRRILQDAQRAQRSLQGQANSVNDALEKMKEMLMQQNEDRTDPSEAPETTEEGE
jgi:flagellar biosynthesis GTPase FlhF